MQSLARILIVGKDAGNDKKLAETLNKGGCLLPIYAMLTSIYQLNALIQRHNAIDGNAPVHQLKLEVVPDLADPASSE